LGISRSFSRDSKLRSDGAASDPHPADILREFLAAETVRLMDFSDHDDWASIIMEETNKDIGIIMLCEREVSKDMAKQSAALVAQALVNTPLPALEDHCLGEIQNWHDEDEMLVEGLCAVLVSGEPLAPSISTGTYAAHVVAATTIQALRAGSDIPSLFTEMLHVLQQMHETNPSWGPLFLRHPGQIARHRIRG
jgi:hypothetical protein